MLILGREDGALRTVTNYAVYESTLDGPSAVFNVGRYLDRIVVADCSLMPVLPRANTNVPAVVVGERIADELLASL